jgi:methyl-accepting chemotaxis protein
MGLAKMSIGKKLGLSFLVLVLMMALASAVTTTGILSIRRQTDLAQGSEDLHTSLLQREIEHLRWVMGLQEYLISGVSQPINLQMDPTKCNLGQWLASDGFSHLLESFPHFKDEFDQLYEPHLQLHSSAKTIEEWLLRGDVAGAEEAYYAMTVPSLTQTVAILDGVRSELAQDVGAINSMVKGQITRILQYSLLIFAIAVVMSIAVAVVVTRGIARPLRVLKDVAQKIGSGNLGVRWNIKSRDEVGDLSASLEQMAGGLRKLVQGIQTNSESVNSLSQSLSAMAVQTGAAITEVASTSNEFASASVNMAESAESMRLNNDHAVNELERGIDMLRVAVKDVDSARSDVQNLTEAVDNLAEKSKEIGAIVDLITQISDQTNLLALNAAIEAARAGESGRGFAVVAEEVRRLAEQSGKASGEIADLIRHILRGTEETMERMEKADESVERVDKQIDLTGNTFVSISKVFQEVAAQVVEIARAAEDIGAGSEEIAASTEEQSAMTNNLADNAEKLAELAVHLQEQISSFQGF